MSTKPAPKAPAAAVKPAEIASETPSKAPAPAAKKTVSVKFLRTHPRFSVAIGEVTELSQADFDRYTEDGPFFERIHTR